MNVELDVWDLESSIWKDAEEQSYIEGDARSLSPLTPNTLEARGPIQSSS